MGLRALNPNSDSMVDTEISKWNLMTFPWPFKDLFKQKSQELCWKKERNAPRLAQLLWGYVIYIYTFYYDNLWIKHIWKPGRHAKYLLINLLLLSTHLKDPCLKTWYSYMKNIKLLKIGIFQWLPLIFNDFSRQNGIFPGQHQIPWLFKVSLKFHDFSRLVWTMDSFFCSIFKQTKKNMSPNFARHCQDSWAVVTCTNMWPDRSFESTIKQWEIFTRFQLWAHKPFVKWVPDVCDKLEFINYEDSPITPFNPLRAKFFRGNINIYICILCHYSTLIWHRYLKSFLK